jgi:hypothetical protein
MKTTLETLSSLLLLILSNCSGTSDEKNTSKSNFTYQADSAVVYIYDGLMGQSIVDTKGNLDTTVVTSKKLTSPDINNLISLLNIKQLASDSSMDYAEAACCSPHHGIVLYKNSKPSKWISICFDCNCINSTISTDVRPAHLIDFVTNLHLKVGKKELPIEQFGTFDPNDEIGKINERRYGKSYQSLRHNL